MTSELINQGYDALSKMDLFLESNYNSEIKIYVKNWKEVFTDIVLRLEGLEEKK
jgi:hypothetical protein